MIFQSTINYSTFQLFGKNCLTDINRDSTRQYTVPNNNTIVSQIDFAKSWLKARYMIMIPLTGVIIVNLFIFHKWIAHSSHLKKGWPCWKHYGRAYGIKSQFYVPKIWQFKAMHVLEEPMVAISEKWRLSRKRHINFILLNQHCLNSNAYYLMIRSFQTVCYDF